MVPEPSHEGQEAKIGVGLAIRGLHGSSMDGRVHRDCRHSAALLALRLGEPSGGWTPHLPELSSHGSLQPLPNVLAVAALPTAPARRELSHEPDVALGESPSSSGTAAAAPSVWIWQYGLWDAEFTDGARFDLSTDNGAGDEPALGDVE